MPPARRSKSTRPKKKLRKQSKKASSGTVEKDLKRGIPMMAYPFNSLSPPIALNTIFCDENRALFQGAVKKLCDELPSFELKIQKKGKERVRLRRMANRYVADFLDHEERLQNLESDPPVASAEFQTKFNESGGISNLIKDPRITLAHVNQAILLLSISFVIGNCKSPYNPRVGIFDSGIGWLSADEFLRRTILFCEVADILQDSGVGDFVENADLGSDVFRFAILYRLLFENRLLIEQGIERPRRRGAPTTPLGILARGLDRVFGDLPKSDRHQLIAELARDFLGTNTSERNVRELLRIAAKPKSRHAASNSNSNN